MRERVITILLMVLMAVTLTAVPVPIAQEKEDLTFDLIAPVSIPLWVRVCEIFKRSCEDIGVDISIRPLETSAWVDAMTNTHDFDIAMCGMLMEATPSYLPSLFHSKYSEEGFNIAGVEEEALDALLDSSRTTTDPDALKGVIWQIQEEVAKSVYSIPIFTEEIVFAYTSDFTGFVGMPGGVVDHKVYLDVHPVGAEYGGELKIGMLEDIKTSNTLLRTLALESYIDNMFYDTLIELAPDLSLVPWLAESWEVSDDGLTWTFHLVDNATWHDGVPFTADDVDFTIRTVLENKPPTWHSYFEPIESTKVVDDYTIQVHTSEPYAWMTTTFFTFPIIPKHAWEGVPWNTTDPPLIGTGPFKWVTWLRGEYIELERNPNYWRAGKPRLDKVVWKAFANAPAMILALGTGELNLMYRYIPPETVKTLMADPNVGVSVAPGLNFRYLIPNMRRPPLDDVNLRRALAHAVDKDTIVNALLLGYAIPIDSFVSQAWGVWNNPEVTTYEYNLTKANKILDDAGYIDVDGDGIRELPGASPPPPPTPAWVWVLVGVAVSAVCSGGVVYAITRRRKPT